MIHQFALEPDLVATWHDRKEYLFFDEKFSLTTRRVIAAYPKKWSQMVWKKFKSGPDGQNQNAETRLSALLQYLDQVSIKYKNTNVSSAEWLIKAEEDLIEPVGCCRAIVARNNPRRHPNVIEARDLMVNGNDLWKVPDIPPTARNAEEIVSTVSPLFSNCKKIILIDPNFKAEESRFRNTIQMLAVKIWPDREINTGPEFELHTSIDRFYSEQDLNVDRDEERQENHLDHLKGQILSNLPSVVPQDRKLIVKIWTRKKNGQKLHNRYILTEFTGVMLGVGLDEAGEGSNDTDDIALLTPSQHHLRWQQYTSSTPGFDLVQEPLEVLGTLDL